MKDTYGHRSYIDQRYMYIYHLLNVIVEHVFLLSWTVNLAGADPEPPLPGGAQVTNEAEGFTEARSAERGRVGEGVTPSRR